MIVKVHIPMDRILLPRPTQHHTVSPSTTHLSEVSKRNSDGKIGHAGQSTFRWKVAAGKPISRGWLLLPLSLIAVGVYTHSASESTEYIQSPAIGKPAPRTTTRSCTPGRHTEFRSLETCAGRQSFVGSLLGHLVWTVQNGVSRVELNGTQIP